MAGTVVPIVLWQIKKDQSEVIDTHGRIVVLPLRCAGWSYIVFRHVPR